MNKCNNCSKLNSLGGTKCIYCETPLTPINLNDNHPLVTRFINLTKTSTNLAIRYLSNSVSYQEALDLYFSEDMPELEDSDDSEDMPELEDDDIRTNLINNNGDAISLQSIIARWSSLMEGNSEDMIRTITNIIGRDISNITTSETRTPSRILPETLKDILELMLCGWRTVCKCHYHNCMAFIKYLQIKKNLDVNVINLIPPSVLEHIKQNKSNFGIKDNDNIKIKIAEYIIKNLPKYFEEVLCNSITIDFIRFYDQNSTNIDEKFGTLRREPQIIYMSLYQKIKEYYKYCGSFIKQKNVIIDTLRELANTDTFIQFVTDEWEMPKVHVHPASKKSISALKTFTLESDLMDCDCQATCVICLDELKKGVKVTELNCKHIFCTDCINKWLGNESRHCPICKSNIEEVSNKRKRNQSVNDSKLEAKE
jgi:hypothetical protein